MQQQHPSRRMQQQQQKLRRAEEISDTGEIVREEVVVTDPLEGFRNYSNAADPDKAWENNEKIQAISSMEGKLRATLLQKYDRNSYPWEWAWDQNFFEEYDREGENEGDNRTESSKIRQGLPVDFGLNFHKVHDLDVAESTADLVIWVRISWVDPRLAWDPNDFNGLKNCWFYVTDGIGGGEVSEIWTPDIYLWNQEETMANSLANTYATVSSDGSVYWSRPGRLKSTCKYLGLENFPFDDLSCALEFGSWAHSGLYIRPSKLDGTGYSTGNSETSGSSFVEFEIRDVEVESVVYPPFLAAPEEDWPVLIYTLTFKRSSAPYLRGVLLTNIMLNFAAFACFWMPPHVGERMGLAITCVLAAVAGELVMASNLPNCSEMSWYNKFMFGSSGFALLVVFQSAVVIYFFFLTKDDLVPGYIKWLKRKLLNEKKKEKDSSVEKAKDHHSNDMTQDDEEEDNAPTNLNRKASINSVKEEEDSDAQTQSPENERMFQRPKLLHYQTEKSIDIFKSTTNRARKRVTLNLNDSMANGSTLAQFLHTQNALTGDTTHDAEDDAEKEAAKERANQKRWMKVGENIDSVCRVIVPAGYLAFLAYIFKDTGHFEGFYGLFS